MFSLPKEKLKQKEVALAQELARLATLQDRGETKYLSQEHKRISELIALLEQREQLKEERQVTELLLQDGEMKELAQDELSQIELRQKALEEKIRNKLVPVEKQDLRNVFLEIRAGTGGEEAALFAADLLKMYQRFAEKKGFSFHVVEQNETGLGGIREAVIQVKGKKVFSDLKFERGTHRVQRVPKTESQGRIHTSASTVAVLPEAEEVEVDLKESDLKIEAFRASGAGGQHVNKTSSAVRITHMPSGIVVSCQDERSQYQNRMKALQILRSYILERKQREEQKKEAKARKTQVGSGDRSEKVRTYNFPQDRVTDHRLEGDQKNYPLAPVLEGNLDRIIQNLRKREEDLKIAAWLKEELEEFS